MTSKIRTITIALVFGVVATVATALYINSVREGIVESGMKKTVYLVSKAIPAGTPVVKLESEGMVEKKEIPKRYAADGALDDLSGHQERVIAFPLSSGEQITLKKLRASDQSEMVFKLTADKIALAIPVDAVTGVDGRIKVGDRVVVLAAFTPGPGGSDISRAMLKGIEVLGVSEDAKNTGAGVSGKRTITLAVNLSEAEKLVFAEEKGKIWVGLEAPTDSALPATAGQTMESVFK